MRAVLLAVGLCLCLVSRTAAQSTATPTAFITGAQATILFPQAIRFTVATNLPAGGIRSAQLTLAGSNPYATLDVDVAQAERAAKAPGTLVVVWTISTAPAPTLFEIIHANWTLTAADGRQQTILNDVQLVDPRADWTASSDSSGKFNLIAPKSVGDLNAVLRAVQVVYHQFFSAETPASTFTWVVYPPTVPPGCSIDQSGQSVAVDKTTGAAIACDPAHAQAFFAAHGYRPVSADFGTGAAAIDAISADLVDARFGARWNAASAPDWFRAGFSAFFTPSHKTALLAPALTAARAQQMVPLDRLENTTQRDEVWRAESYALVLYLAGRTGVDGLMRLANGIGPAAPFQSSLEAALGQPLAALVPTVQRWLLTDAAVNAFNYVPYGPATATPAPTASPSATATTPPTATATPRPSRTPEPTVRPTWTPIPPTPSVTPRPANSLALWTPVPTPAPPVAQPPSVTLSPLEIVLLVVVAAITVGLIALYIRLGKRT